MSGKHNAFVTVGLTLAAGAAIRRVMDVLNPARPIQDVTRVEPKPR